MQNRSYVIVGAEVGQATSGLLGNQIVPAQTTGATPLDVEFIGRLLVDLSERSSAVSPAEMTERVAQAKAALTVSDLGNRTGNPPLTNAEIAGILAGTTVEIRFESRVEASGQPDDNHRILVVPSDHTLKLGQDEQQQQGASPGFRPPLSYELDFALMVGFLEKALTRMVEDFAQKNPPGWSTALKDALLVHVAEWVRHRADFVDSAGNPAVDDPRAAILADPVRAFHRSVGIYATNMCR